MAIAPVTKIIRVFDPPELSIYRIILNAEWFYIDQGEYLRLQPQDESDNSESIYTTIATLRFGNPHLKATGNP
ncbi:hypothetical protein, partial [Halorubrum ezzemoulense]|uniref:hypothetical protein n=1 Tax=Halorubrum ezzemoulense TaxID=337243 RepID=UPI0023303899